MARSAPSAPKLTIANMWGGTSSWPQAVPSALTHSRADRDTLYLRGGNEDPIHGAEWLAHRRRVLFRGLGAYVVDQKLPARLSLRSRAELSHCRDLKRIAMIPGADDGGLGSAPQSSWPPGLINRAR
jgi:hypothetical protein